MAKIKMFRTPESMNLDEWAALRPGDLVRALHSIGTILVKGNVYIVDRTYESDTSGEALVALTERPNFGFAAGRLAVMPKTAPSDYLTALQQVLNG